MSRLGRRALPGMYGDLAGATLESEILSKQQRDCAHCDGPGGSEPAAFGRGRKRTIRLGMALLAAIALTAGATGLGARGAESEPAGQAAADSGAAAAAPQGGPQSSGITLRVTSTGLSQTISPRSLASEQYQQRLKSPVQFLQRLDLPSREIFLRVGILDAVADKVGTLEIPLKLSKNPTGTTGQPGGKGGN